MAENSENGWNEYKRRVLFQLDELTASDKAILEKLDSLRGDVWTLKAKAAMIGGVGGIVASVLVSLIIRGLFK